MDRLAPDEAPIGAEAFAAALSPILAARPAGLVLAVSGGPDSMAMMHLVAGLARRAATPPIVVATVDHGLRAGSAADAALVVATAQALGWTAHCLRWEGPKPTRAVQEAARRARYGLLAAFCRRQGADHLLTAHTMDDQAETVLFRLIRGSGPAGLSGMRAATRRDGIVHARPLLGFRKAQLLATCAAHRWSYVTDPSNADPRYARARLRRLLPLLEAEGLDSSGFARLAARLQRTDDALRDTTARALREVCLPAPAGRWRLDPSRLAALPLDIVIRLLGLAVAALGHDRPLRLEGLERLATALLHAAAGGEPLVRTFHGTVLRLAADRLDIAAEAPRRRAPAPTPRPGRSATETPQTPSSGVPWQ